MIMRFLTLSALLIITACSVTEKDTQYWQRINLTESIHAQGPKAQEQLTRDIARCVAELKELIRLGELESPIKVNYHGRVLDPDELERIEGHTRKQYSGDLFAELHDYKDFDGCMTVKGWQRTRHVEF